MVLYELWINGFLSNPLTHIVNTTSNALTIAYTIPERALATGIDVLRSASQTIKRTFHGRSQTGIIRYPQEFL